MSLAEKIEKIYKQTLFCRNEKDGSVFYFSASDFPGLHKEPFSFVTGAGHRLQGYFYSYEDKYPERVVVFDHGMGAGHFAYMREIELLARHGFLVYSYDHTGCTESEGETTQGFAGSLSDLDSCISAIKNHPNYGNRKISVMGHSWGGFSTMNITSFHPEITHVVAMSGLESVRAAHKQFIPFFLAPLRNRLFKIERDTSGSYAEAAAAHTIKYTTARTLIIHSSDDKTVSARLHFAPIKEAAKDNKNVRFLLVKGKNHSPNYTVDAVKYKDAFFKALTDKRKRGELETEEQKAAFVKQFDWERMTEQDESVWAEIFKTLDS